jgi:catalase
MPSPMWDALVIAGSADAMAGVGAAVEFVQEQFRHCKPILLAGSAPALLAAAGITAPSDAGFVDAAARGLAPKAVAQALIQAVGKHRHYEREQEPALV